MGILKILMNSVRTFGISRRLSGFLQKFQSVQLLHNIQVKNMKNTSSSLIKYVQKRVSRVANKGHSASIIFFRDALL